MSAINNSKEVAVKAASPLKAQTPSSPAITWIKDSIFDPNLFLELWTMHGLGDRSFYQLSALLKKEDASANQLFIEMFGDEKSLKKLETNQERPARVLKNSLIKECSPDSLIRRLFTQAEKNSQNSAFKEIMTVDQKLKEKFPLSLYEKVKKAHPPLSKSYFIEMQRVIMEDFPLLQLWRAIHKKPVVAQAPNLPAINADLPSIRQWINLPNSQASLRRISVINLKNCNLQAIPKELFKLENLVSLDLSQNPIWELPREIETFPQLQILNLRGTKIEKLPPTITNLRNLQNLNLRRTKIQELPENIGDLVNLWSLDISRTFISKLPEDIDQLINLRGFDLSNTPIDKLPDGIQRLISLWDLNISSTLISELPPAIRGLVNLRTFYLSNTPIEELPNEIGELRNLQDLDISDSRIRRLPDAIRGLERLFMLKVSDYSIELSFELNQWLQENRVIIETSEEANE